MQGARDEHQEDIEARRLDRSAQRAFLYGALAAAVLSLVVVLGALVEVTNARADVTALASRADRSTFLIGDIGRQAARMQLALVRALHEEGSDIERRLARFARANDRIDEEVRELDPLLTPAERRVWPSFVERLARVREELDDATAALAAGDERRVERRLDDIAALMTALQEQVDTLAHLNQSESEQLLSDARDRLARSLWIVGLLGVLLLGGSGAIWIYAFRAERSRRTLEESLRALARDNRELDIFAGRAAHDIRNLLVPVSTAARALEKAGADPARVKTVARQLRRSSERAVDVLEALLAFARANASSDARAPISAAVPEQVDATLEDFRAHLASRDVVVDADVEDGRVLCDPRLLRIVIANLLDNALKFAGGDGRGHVHLTGRARGDEYTLEFHDDGPGIPEEALTSLFQPFYRVGGSRASGTGLGLATVYRIVDAHGGAVEVESRLGQGSLFRVTLPRGRGDGSGSRQRPSTSLDARQ